MLIIIDKISKNIVDNLGTNSIFSDGNIPNLEPKDNEIFVQLHDSNEMAKIIMSAYDYELVLNEKNEVTDVIVNKTLEQYQAEQPILSSPPTSEERLSAIEDLLITLI